MEKRDFSCRKIYIADRRVPNHNLYMAKTLRFQCLPRSSKRRGGTHWAQRGNTRAQWEAKTPAKPAKN